MRKKTKVLWLFLFGLLFLFFGSQNHALAYSIDQQQTETTGGELGVYKYSEALGLFVVHQTFTAGQDNITGITLRTYTEPTSAIIGIVDSNNFTPCNTSTTWLVEGSYVSTDSFVYEQKDIFIPLATTTLEIGHDYTIKIFINPANADNNPFYLIRNSDGGNYTDGTLNYAASYQATSSACQDSTGDLYFKTWFSEEDTSTTTPTATTSAVTLDDILTPVKNTVIEFTSIIITNFWPFVLVFTILAGFGSAIMLFFKKITS